MTSPSNVPASSSRGSASSSKVFVITGPSGVGKGTLIKRLLAACPNLELSISATTRAPREGEVDGRDYHFLTREQFDRRIEADDFLEFATYSDNRYGTLRSEVEKRLRAGHSVVLEIEVQGAQQVRADRCRLGPDLHLAARRDGSAGAAEGAGDRLREAIDKRLRSPARSWPRATTSTTSWSTTRSTAPPRSWSGSCVRSSARARPADHLDCGAE